MNNKKKYIDTYKTLYGVDLVVCKNVTLKDLQSKYTYATDAELEDSIFEPQLCSVQAKNKKTGRYVLLVMYNYDNSLKDIDKKVDFIDGMCHEAGHVTLDLYAFIQEHNIIECQEPFCYMLGYVAGCIYKTWTKK